MGLKGFVGRHYHLRIAAYRAAVRLLARPRLAALRIPVAVEALLAGYEHLPLGQALGTGVLTCPARITYRGPRHQCPRP